MSIDTKQLRDEAQAVWTTKWSKSLVELCDEIDRLRDQVNLQRDEIIWMRESAKELHPAKEKAEREIDRLRQDNERYMRTNQALAKDNRELREDIDRVHKRNDIVEGNAKEWHHIYEQTKAELDALRDQLRPRSIKDEPPPKDLCVLVWMDKCSEPGWYSACNPTERTGPVWLPKLPAPPAPDKFEEFYEKANTQTVERGRMINKDDARLFWDAAKKDKP